MYKNPNPSMYVVYITLLTVCDFAGQPLKIWLYFRPAGCIIIYFSITFAWTCIIMYACVHAYILSLETPTRQNHQIFA